MIGTDEIVVVNFESRLNRLMDAYTKLSAENAVLRGQLELQSVELDKIRGQYKELTQSYTNLKLAKMISVNDSEVGDTRRRLSKLVREVDKCIALLNASGQTDDML